jgi:hypothetical protein
MIKKGLFIFTISLKSAVQLQKEFFMKTTKISVLFLMAATAISFLLGACTNPVGDEEKAVFSINLGGGAGGRMAHDPTDPATAFPTVNDLKYVVTFTPASGNPIKITNSPDSKNKITGKVAVGTYAVALDIYLVYLKEDNETRDESSLYPSGGAADSNGNPDNSVTISAEVTNTIPITVTYQPGVEGDGSDEDPFKVYDADTLGRIGQGTDAAWNGDWTLSANYIVIRDIDMANVTGFTPIGFGPGNPPVITPFTGSFDGNGKTISALVVSDTSDNMGLFAKVGTSGVVQNLGMVDVSVDGLYYVGGIVGHNEGTVENCYATGDVNGINLVGGIVGQNEGTVKNCYATGDVNGNNLVGGVAGKNIDALVEDCYATGVVDGNSDVGGVVGNNFGSSAEVKNCYASGDVTSNQRAGGVVGYNDQGTVEYCYAAGNVTSSANYAGGVVGHNQGGTVQNCYATGDVSGNDNVGGVVGQNSDTSNLTTVQNCYATGDVSGHDNVGGVVGYNEGYSAASLVLNCYATGDVDGNDYTGGIVGQNFGTYISVANCVALNSDLVVVSSDYGRVSGNSVSLGLSNNFGRDGMKVNTSPVAWASYLSDKDGEDVTATEWDDAGWWSGTALFSSGNSGAWTLENGKLPTLKDMPNADQQNPTVQ